MLTKKQKGILFGCLVFLGCSVLFSLLAGSSGLLLQRLADHDEKALQIMLHVRLPRTLAAVSAGSALAISGAVLQSVLSNPMASPSLLGVNAGAGLFCLIGAIVFPHVFSLQVPAAFFGAFITALLIVGTAIQIRASKMTVILAGLAVSQIFSALIDVLITLFPDSLSGYASFKIGTLSALSMNKVIPCAAACLIGIVLVFLCSKELEVFSMGSERAKSLGMNTRYWMLALLMLAALLAGSAVALGGMLGFLGLIVPNLVSRFFAGKTKAKLTACMLSGSGLLCFCDALGRVLFAPYELPAGILLALAGGPFFLWLLLHEKRHGKA